MKKVLFFAALFFLASVSTAFSQTWYYTKPNGQPGGSATYSGPSIQQYSTPDATAPWRANPLPLYNQADEKRKQQENRLRELEIQQQELELEQTRRSLHETKRETVQAPEKAENEVPPEFRQWFDDNAFWYQTDRKMQAYADKMGDFIKETEGLTGVPLLNRVREEVENRFPEKFSSTTTTSRLNCRDNCKNLFVRGELKPGMTVGQCVKVLCK